MRNRQERTESANLLSQQQVHAERVFSLRDEIEPQFRNLTQVSDERHKLGNYVRAKARECRSRS